MEPSVFIGSSSEQIAIAEAVEVNLTPVAEISSWKHSFTAGQAFYVELLRFKEKFDFAVMVLTPDDMVRSRGELYNAPRDNMIFELGLFLGSLGPDRVFVLIDETVKTKLMSDYSGVAFLTYNGQRADKDYIQAVSPACVRMKQVITRLGPRQNTLHARSSYFQGDLIGLDGIYENMDAAEPIILDDIRTTPGPIRLFFHIASSNIGLRGSLFELIDNIAQEGQVDIKILHASPQSPLFAHDRLLSIDKRPERVLASLRYVNDSLRELEALATSSLRRRTHEYPFIWRIYGLAERLYLMPYFASKNATKSSPVLVFRRKDKSLYQTFVDWFDYAWEKSAPRRVTLSEIITPATPCGAALFLEWNAYHIFGIPKRDILESGGIVRFYGLGGKRSDPSEALNNCALREGNEESDNSVTQLVTSSATDYFRNDGTIHQITVAGEAIIPRLILEKKEHSGHGSMRLDDDNYYMVGYNAVLNKRPKPTSEIAAMLFLQMQHLELF